MNFMKILLILLLTSIVNGQGIVNGKEVIFRQAIQFDRLFIGYIARLNYFQTKMENNSLSSVEERVLYILIKVIFSQIQKFLDEKEKWRPVVYWYSRQG
jgi:hypothetical protein